MNARRFGETLFLGALITTCLLAQATVPAGTSNLEHSPAFTTAFPPERILSLSREASEPAVVHLAELGLPKLGLAIQSALAPL